MNKLTLLILSFALFLTGCNENDHTAREPDSPLNTTSLMKQYALEDNYSQFETLMLDGYDEASITELYETVRRTATDSADIKTVTLVTFDNGKTLLVHLTPVDSEDGEVLIQDVIEIPAEMAAYIENSLNRKFDNEAETLIHKSIEYTKSHKWDDYVGLFDYEPEVSEDLLSFLNDGEDQGKLDGIHGIQDIKVVSMELTSDPEFISKGDYVYDVLLDMKVLNPSEFHPNGVSRHRYVLNRTSEGLKIETVYLDKHYEHKN